MTARGTAGPGSVPHLALTPDVLRRPPRIGLARKRPDSPPCECFAVSHSVAAGGRHPARSLRRVVNSQISSRKLPATTDEQ
jgi:hypothetical protein